MIAAGPSIATIESASGDIVRASPTEIVLNAVGGGGTITMDIASNTVAEIPSSGLTVQGQQYGAQRVTSNFSTSAICSGTYQIPTAPPQYTIPFVGGQNIGYEIDMMTQNTAAGGINPVWSVPSGVGLTLACNGFGAQDTFVHLAGIPATGVGTGAYGAANAFINLRINGTITGAVGATGPVTISALPVVAGHTMTIFAGSDIYLYPST